MALNEYKSFKEYLSREIDYIKWVSKRYNISHNEAAKQWVDSGMAELYADKYRKVPN